MSSNSGWATQRRAGRVQTLLLSEVSLVMPARGRNQVASRLQHSICIKFESHRPQLVQLRAAAATGRA